MVDSCGIIEPVSAKTQMLRNLKRLLLGITLIVFASAALLLSDLKQRSETNRSVPRIGLLQTASVQLLDDTVRGIVDSLAENGFTDGQTINIQKYNAQGDIALTNSIAKEMVNANFDLLMTVSTVSLQAVANANRGGKTVQVFGAVADPSVAGVGISHDKPLDHPRNLVGIGSFLPVADSFQIAREMFPDLKRVGVERNPTIGAESGEWMFRVRRSERKWDEIGVRAGQCAAQDRGTVRAGRKVSRWRRDGARRDHCRTSG